MKTIASELSSASALASTLSGRLESFLSPLLVRWLRRLHLQDLLGEEVPAWQHARGKKTRSRRQIWDAHHHSSVSSTPI